MLDARRHPPISAATNWRDSGKPVRKLQRQRPRSKTAHADAGDIHAAFVHAIPAFDVIQQCRQHIRSPPVVGWALWRHDDEWELPALFNQFCWPVNFDQLQIVAAFAGTVQKQQQRPFLFGLLGVISRQCQPIPGRNCSRDFAMKFMRGLFHGRNISRNHHSSKVCVKIM